MTSPLAVGFRGLVAGQSPHVIHRQAGRPEGFQRQRGEPVQGHKWEEAGIIDWVLVSGKQGGKIGKRLSCLKGRACTEVLHRAAAAERWERRRAFARRRRRGVKRSCGVWTVICMLLAEAREDRLISGHMFKKCCPSLRERLPPLFRGPPATTLKPSTPGSEKSNTLSHLARSRVAAVWI